MDKILPNNYQAECAVLGGLLISENNFEETSELSASSFYDPRNRDIYAAMRKLFNDKKPINIITVQEELERSKSTVPSMYLIDVSNCVATSVGLKEHVRIVKDKANRRQFISLLYELLEKSFDDSTDYSNFSEIVYQKTWQISEGRDNEDVLMCEAKKIMLENIDMAEKGIELGIPTGFPEIDKRSGGFSLGDLIVIGADTSVGKTSLAWTFATNAAKEGYPIGYFSLEMSPSQLFGRAVSRESMIVASRITNPSCSGERKLSKEELNRVKSVSEEIEKYPIFIANARTVESICLKVRVWVRKFGIKGVYIDYLQILATSSKITSETNFLTNVTRKFQQLAKELNIFICLLSQFSRPTAGESNAVSLHRLRGSQEIASAADVIILITRPEQDGTRFPYGFEQISTRGTALIDIKKGRNIGTFKFVCRYDAEHTTFFPIKGNPPLASLDSEKNAIKVENDKSSLYF